MKWSVRGQVVKVFNLRVSISITREAFSRKAFCGENHYLLFFSKGCGWI